jgi:hypothetical protein
MPSTARSAIWFLAQGLTSVTGPREPILTALRSSDTRDTRVSPSMEQQFDSFIVAPLKKFAENCSSTVVLVIDGVDKCPEDIRSYFLSAISEGVPKLPRTVKVFFASHTLLGVQRSLEALGPLNILVTVGVGMDDGDIELYLEDKLCKMAGQEETWPIPQRKLDASALAPKAGGLFQWAHVLILLLADHAQPREMISHILNLSSEIHLDVLRAVAQNTAHPMAASTSTSATTGHTM